MILTVSIQPCGINGDVLGHGVGWHQGPVDVMLQVEPDGVVGSDPDVMVGVGVGGQLEKGGQVVDHAEDGDGDDKEPRGPSVADAVERVAHRQVPLHRDGHREVDAA